METKRLITSLIYKIEPKAGGGFIARSADPSVQPIEAPTRDELQKKIQAQITASIASQLPGLNLSFNFGKGALQNGKTANTLRIFNASNGSIPVGTEANPAEINQFAEQFAGIIQKDFPELSQALAARVAGSQVSSGSTQSEVGAFAKFATDHSFHTNGDSLDASAANTPIVPEKNNSWKVLSLFVVTLMLALVVYFFFHR
jgi:hypothetical protein